MYIMLPIVHFKMTKLINFMYILPQWKQKTNPFSEKQPETWGYNYHKPWWPINITTPRSAMLTKAQKLKPLEEAIPTKANCTIWAAIKYQGQNSKAIKHERSAPHSLNFSSCIYFSKCSANAPDVGHPSPPPAPPLKFFIINYNQVEKSQSNTIIIKAV